MSRDTAVTKGLEVSTTLSEAATKIISDSYAIYRVDDDTHQAVQDAWLEARGFFASVQHGSNDEKAERRKAMMDTCRVIQDGHVLGFHVPSAAKFLFRAYCDEHERPDQPWPSESLRIASFRLARKLDEILNQCCTEIRFKIAEIKEKDTPAKAGTKRQRQNQSGNNGHQNDNISHPGNCPLDYFLYHGHADPAVASNCTAHVDRGFLIAICLTNNSPGLEVLPASSGMSGSDNSNAAYGEYRYVCPEDSMQRASLYTETSSYTNLICILAGDQWRQLDPETTVQACVHRVRNNLRASRLSISYELRI
jgi:hypothetical protein